MLPAVPTKVCSRAEACTSGHSQLTYTVRTAGHMTTLTLRAPAASESTQRTRRFERSQPPAAPPGEHNAAAMRIPVGNRRAWQAARATNHRTSAGYQRVSRCVTASEWGTPGALPVPREGLDHWSSEPGAAPAVQDGTVPGRMSPHRAPGGPFLDKPRDIRANIDTDRSRPQWPRVPGTWPVKVELAAAQHMLAAPGVGRRGRRDP